MTGFDSSAPARLWGALESSLTELHRCALTASIARDDTEAIEWTSRHSTTTSAPREIIHASRCAASDVDSASSAAVRSLEPEEYGVTSTP